MRDTQSKALPIVSLDAVIGSLYKVVEMQKVFDAAGGPKEEIARLKMMQESLVEMGATCEVRNDEEAAVMAAIVDDALASCYVHPGDCAAEERRARDAVRSLTKYLIEKSEGRVKSVAAHITYGWNA